MSNSETLMLDTVLHQKNASIVSIQEPQTTTTRDIKIRAPLTSMSEPRFKILWINYGQVLNSVNHSLINSNCEVAEVLHFPIEELGARERQQLEHWVLKVNVIIINSSTRTRFPLGRSFNYIKRFGLIVINIDSYNPQNRVVVDFPNNFHRNVAGTSQDVSQKLNYILDCYESLDLGIIIPNDSELKVYSNFYGVTPDDLKSLLSNSEELQKMSPRAFEILVADLLSIDGWEVDLVQRINAKGPDIIATSSKIINGVPQLLIVECKKYSLNSKVDINVVRKVMSWVNEEYRSTMGMIVTSSTFTRDAEQLAEKKHQWKLGLKDNKSLHAWMENSFKDS